MAEPEPKPEPVPEFKLRPAPAVEEAEEDEEALDPDATRRFEDLKFGKDYEIM